MEPTAGPTNPNSTDGASKGVFYILPHTHWEGAVFKTRADYLDMGLPNIVRVLRIMKARPEYRFVLDQVCYVRPFLERYPHEAEAFRQFVAEGRIAIVAGTDVMLDVNMPGGESFVRQVLYGKGYYRRELGVDVTVGWQLDTFGHHAQMPQLLRLAGFGSFWFFRGVADWTVPSEFHWEGIDGSRIPAFWLKHGYALTYGTPRTLPEFTGEMLRRYSALEPQSSGPDRVGVGGADVCEPEQHLPELVEAFNLQPDAPIELRFATPADYEAAVAARGESPVIAGELNPIFQGAYSSRIELKQLTREIERLLGTAEKLGVLLRVAGAPTDDAVLWRAWEPALFNQAHDLMSGVMTDYVYADTMSTYEGSRRIGDEEVQARLSALAARIDTRGDGVPLVVFNPLGWNRTDLVTADVGFSAGGAAGLRIVAPDGREVASQLLAAERDEAGALVQARVAFIAADVPALGHAVYRAHPTASASPAPPGAPVADNVLENEHYRVTVDLTTGAIASIHVKHGGWEALSGPANVVAREDDHGDLWEPYHPLDGGSRIAMRVRHPAPAPGAAVLSTDDTGAAEPAVRGSVVSEFTVSHPFGETGEFRTTIRLIAGLPRIDIRTRIRNNDAFVRYRAMFPTSLPQGRITHEIPFGAIERPEGIEFPAQNWVDYSDGERGVAMLNRGIPGGNVADGAMLLSLLRCTSIVAYGFGGGYEPGMSSDTGLQLGQVRDFEYALTPHAGAWADAGVHRSALEYNHPMLAAPAAVHPGTLPAVWGLVDSLDPRIVVSALKEGEGGTAVLRLYEATGQPVTGATVRFAPGVEWAEEVNLMEDPGQRVDVSDGVIRLDFRGFEIKTLRLRFRPL